MATTLYAPDESVRAARARYFEINHFGADGGYGAAWVDFAFGPIPMPIPNTAARVRAVKFHDLHHLVTGYDTDLLGELEISAWELGAGCGDFAAAWALNLGGLAAGALLAPRRTWRAFRRGRRSASLYDGRPFEPLLEGTVAGLRAATRVPEGAVDTTFGDLARFVPLALVGLATWGVLFVPGLVLGPLLAAYLVRAKAKAATSARDAHSPAGVS